MSTLLTQDQKDSYECDGFLLFRNVLDFALLESVEANFLDLVESCGGTRNHCMGSPEFAQLLLGNRELERAIYDGVRKLAWLSEFSLAKPITSLISSLLNMPIGLLEKIPFRVDLPLITREMAPWHQDYNYVKGNTDIVTTWIPLQDTNYAMGCLKVMPGSHHLGVLNHDITVLSKRHCPSGIFNKEVRYIEMQKGDLLLFNALLLHSSSLNMSDSARISLQPRYSRLSDKTDSSMGSIIPV